MPRLSRLTALRTPLIGATAGVAVLSLLFHAAGGGPAAAADTVYAHAQLLDLKIDEVDPLGLRAFSGRYGEAKTPPPESEDPGDFSDPNGVLDYVTIGSADSRTGRSAAKVYAQTHTSGMKFELNGLDFVSTGAVDTYAECVPEPYGPYAFAYARTDASLVLVFGRPVAVGTTVLPVTGADLGKPDIGPSTLTVELAPYQRPDSGSAVAGLAAAAAGVDVSVSAVLNNTRGTQVYSGPMTRLEIGHVEVHCAVDSPTQPPTTTRPTTSPPPTTRPPTTRPPTTRPPTTRPPTTRPPTTRPPTTRPPTTRPPTTRPPTTPPTTTTSPPTSPPAPHTTTPAPPGPDPSDDATTTPPPPPTDHGSGGNSGGNSGGGNGGSDGGAGGHTTGAPNPPPPTSGLAASGARIAWVTAIGAGVLAAGIVLVVAVRRRHGGDA